MISHRTQRNRFSVKSNLANQLKDLLRQSLSKRYAYYQRVRVEGIHQDSGKRAYSRVDQVMNDRVANTQAVLTLSQVGKNIIFVLELMPLTHLTYSLPNMSLGVRTRMGNSIPSW